ncbi:hypothetical protein GALMADRAFT_241078 [Galerina marginata CBS 339.88]|uniref:Uncharacterized protein n=1 Tax=Galerina marginata (strain CBS 339.88) TaxID=685588 RepID=A0A067TL89_GALM3|nr:hypothetical protein GALMADRAFT_241078 [Galerina marginata CBS 339.88]
MKHGNSPKKSVDKSPASRGPKKVDVSLPGPSPKRARHSSDEPSIMAPPKVKKSSHVRATSSVSLLKQVAQQVEDLPPVNKKPESISAPVRKPKSKAKSVAADDDFDDSVSVADSSISVSRIRRNESERIEYFKNQSECGKLEPHAAECNKCNKTVNLGRKQTYAVRPWEIHRARCDQKPTIIIPTTPDSSKEPLEVEKSISSSPPASTSQTPARRPSETERREFLEGDKQIMDLEKHRVCCRKCQNWVDLSPTLPYATGNWVKHKNRCSDAVPSNRVAAAKRKLLVVNDKQVKSFMPRKIECGFCGVTVQLEGEGDFNLTKWDEHKLNCTKTIPISRSESVSSIPFPSRYSMPPPSSASTEDTLVVDVANSRSSQGVKRSREEPEVIAEEDARPSARQRTASYLPPQVEPPNTVMGWFMLPFHSFVRGFKESLKDRP